MMQKLIRILQPSAPEFRQMTADEIPKILRDAYLSPFFWTPRYQKTEYSEELLKYLKFLQRKKSVSVEDRRTLVENVLTEFHTLKNQQKQEQQQRSYEQTEKTEYTEYQKQREYQTDESKESKSERDCLLMQKNVYFPRNSINRFHGTVDWVYSSGGSHMVPVMFFPHTLNAWAGIAMAVANMFWRTAVRDQLEQERMAENGESETKENKQTKESNVFHGYSIITTGNEWQMIRVSNFLKLQKSVVLEGRNYYRIMHNDEEMISVVLGMLDYALDEPQENVQVLEKAYKYLDERKHMLLAATPEYAQQNSWLGKILTDYYKKRM